MILLSQLVYCAQLRALHLGLGHSVWVAMLFCSYIFTFNFIFMIKNHMVLLSQFTVRSY